MWHGALSWWSIHLSSMSGLTRMTLFLSLSRTSLQKAWLTVCPEGTNSLWTIPLLSKSKSAVVWSLICLFQLSLVEDNLQCTTLLFASWSQDCIKNPWFLTCDPKKSCALAILPRGSKFKILVFSYVLLLNCEVFGHHFGTFSYANVNLFKFNCSLNILNVKRRPDLTRVYTRSISYLFTNIFLQLFNKDYYYLRDPCNHKTLTKKY